MPFDIRPVERNCTFPECPEGGPHTVECDVKYRQDFFDAWQNIRKQFYGEEHEQS